MTLPAHRYHVEFAEWGIAIWNVTHSESVYQLSGLVWLRPVVPYFRLRTVIDLDYYDNPLGLCAP